MRRTLILVGIVAALLLIASPAHASITATAVDGTANSDGSATVPVTFSCPPGWRVIEALVTLSQDDQSIFGMAFVGGVRCTGRPQTFLVRVVSHDGAFHPGTAFASPYLLAERRRDNTSDSGGTFAIIQVH